MPSDSVTLGNPRAHATAVLLGPLLTLIAYSLQVSLSEWRFRNFYFKLNGQGQLNKDYSHIMSSSEYQRLLRVLMIKRSLELRYAFSVPLFSWMVSGPLPSRRFLKTIQIPLPIIPQFQLDITLTLDRWRNFETGKTTMAEPVLWTHYTPHHGLDSSIDVLFWSMTSCTDGCTAAAG